MSARVRRRRWPWLLALLVVAAPAVVLWKRGAATAAAIDPALVVVAKRGSLKIEILETGRVAPREKVEIKSKVAGQVSEVLVEEGQEVKKGQLLIVLDPTDYAREVARAEGDVAQARNAITFAELTLKHKERGVAEDVVPSFDLEKARHDLRTGHVSQKLAQVALSAAQDRLRYTRLVAPSGGTVIQRGIQPGEVVTPGVQATFDGKALLTIADVSRLLVKVDLNQIDVAKVRLSMKATLTLDALPGKTYEATVTRVAAASVKQPNKDLEVFPVELTISGADGRILPGMTADVRIHLEDKPGVLTLPIEAVRKEQGKSFVTRVVGEPQGKQETKKIEVALGARSDRQVEITSGLEEGEKVVIDPASSAENEGKL